MISKLTLKRIHQKTESKLSFKKKFLSNGLASVILNLLRVSQQLLLVPFFISAWGAAYYGEWLTLTIIPTAIGLSDFGFGTAAANSFIFKYAADDKQGASNMAASGFKMVNLVVILCIIISIVLMLTLSYFQVFDKFLIESKDAVISVSLLMGARIIGFYNPLYQAYFRAARRAALGINLTNLLAALNLIGGIIVLTTGGGIVTYSIAMLFIAIGFLAFYSFMSNKILPNIKEFEGQVSRGDINFIKSKGIGFMLSSLWQAIFFQGTTFVVRILLGPVAVTIFNTVRTFIRSISQVNAIIIGSILPELQFEIGANNLFKARKIFRFALLSIIIISSIGIIFLYFGGPWFYEIWTNNALNPPVIMWNVLIVGVFFNGIWWLAGDVLIYSNKPYKFTIPAIIAAIVAIVISFFLGEIYGLTGIAIGSLSLDVMLMFFIIPRSFALLRQPISELGNDFKLEIKEIWAVHLRPLVMKLR